VERMCSYQGAFLKKPKKRGSGNGGRNSAPRARSGGEKSRELKKANHVIIYEQENRTYGTILA